MDKQILEIIKKPDEWKYSIEVSNDNKDSEVKLIIKCRTNGSAQEAVDEAKKCFDEFYKVSEPKTEKKD